MSNPGNIVGGHKANLNNPNTSEESKQHSKEVLDQEFNGGNVDTSSGDKNPNNVAGGLKAYVFPSFQHDLHAYILSTVNNPQVSQDAKDSAQERLNQMGK
ncbi:MAG: hypothetical protein L6R42_003924 [Xanthoria sp. 1 TBL-2021]|nr:MAG: hypothetical protein L6R42_003924 [Xanthoria sp. 1 TBL-2021]